MAFFLQVSNPLLLTNHISHITVYPIALKMGSYTQVPNEHTFIQNKLIFKHLISDIKQVRRKEVQSHILPMAI